MLFIFLQKAEPELIFIPLWRLPLTSPTGHLLSLKQQLTFIFNVHHHVVDLQFLLSLAPADPALESVGAEIYPGVLYLRPTWACCHVPVMFYILFGRYSPIMFSDLFYWASQSSNGSKTGRNWVISFLPEEFHVSFFGHLFEHYHFLEFIEENWHWFAEWWMLRVLLLTRPLTVFSKFCI